VNVDGALEVSSIGTAVFVRLARIISSMLCELNVKVTAYKLTQTSPGTISCVLGKECISQNECMTCRLRSLKGLMKFELRGILSDHVRLVYQSLSATTYDVAAQTR
jgi:hypothetical protein